MSLPMLRQSVLNVALNSVDYSNIYEGFRNYVAVIKHALSFQLGHG